MINSNIDVGQLIVAATVAGVGWGAKKAVDRIYSTLDKHDELIVELSKKIERLLGRHERVTD